MTTTCRKTPEIVADYLDESLPDDRRRLLQEHLTRCARCRREVAELQPLVASLAEWQEQAVPEWQRGSAVVGASDSGMVRSRRWLAWMPAAAALFLVIVVALSTRVTVTADGVAIAFGFDQPESAAGAVDGTYLAGHGLVVDFTRAAAGDLDEETLQRSLEHLASRLEAVAGEDMNVQRPDADSVRETMALAIDQDDTRSRSSGAGEQMLPALEGRLFAALCARRLNLTALPPGEQVALVLPGRSTPAEAPGRHRVHILSRADLMQCRRGDMSPRQLAGQARSYRF